MKSGFDAGRFVSAKNAVINERHENFKAMTEANAANKLFDICKLYQKVKPVLLKVKGVLFFAPKWKAALQLLIDKLDTICPK